MPAWRVEALCGHRTDEPRKRATVDRSGGSRHRKSKRGRGNGHAPIVGDHRVQRWSDQLRSRKMDGVERSQRDGFQKAGRIEEGFVEPNQIDTSKQAAGRFHGSGPEGTDGAQDFGSREAARQSLRLATEVRSQGAGLSFDYDEFHNGR